MNGSMSKSLAYTLLETMRRTMLRGTDLARAQCHTLRLRLLKIDAVVTRNTSTVAVRISSTCPDQGVFRLLVHRLTAGQRRSRLTPPPQQPDIRFRSAALRFATPKRFKALRNLLLPRSTPTLRANSRRPTSRKRSEESQDIQQKTRSRPSCNVRVRLGEEREGWSLSYCQIQCTGGWSRDGSAVVDEPNAIAELYAFDNFRALSDAAKPSPGFLRAPSHFVDYREYGLVGDPALGSRTSVADHGDGGLDGVGGAKVRPVKGVGKPDQRTEQNTAPTAVGVRRSEEVGNRLGAPGAGNAGRA